MANTKNIYQALSAVQDELKVPKGQKNTFGGYSYRSAEDILEAVKPVLKKHELVLILDDELVNIGERYYVKATAQITDGNRTDDGERLLVITASGYAREEETKKGMDASQITGAASSYARKYALNGLFNIDDTKDADTDEHHKVQDSAPDVPADSDDDKLARAKKDIFKALNEQGYDSELSQKRFITRVLKQSKIDTIEQAHEVMDALDNEREEAL